MGRFAGAAGVLLAAALMLAACARTPTDGQRAVAEATAGDEIRIGAFNFPESMVLGELYAQGLAAAGHKVAPVRQLGSREIVEPALEQGRVDMVVEYSGSALNFLQRQSTAASSDSAGTHARLRAAFADRDVTVAAAAPAQNQNAFAMRPDAADRLGVEALSDLRAVDETLVFGGPGECPQRPYCLQGLRDTYGLEFKRFLQVNGPANVTAALATGEIDIGLLFTTDPAVARDDVVVLEDDRKLQPAENITPVIRTASVERLGAELVDAVDRLSATLTTTELAHLNLRVADGDDPADVASGWLQRHGFTQ